MLVSFATGRPFGGSPFLLALASWMLVAIACAPLAAQAPEPKPPAVKPAPRAVDGIEQERPAFFVHAEADRKSLEYWDGEQLKITVRCEVEAYIYVLYTQADQKSYIVFPNSGQPENRIPAKAAVQIPGERDAFRWTVSEPFGKEQLKVIACKQRIEALEKPDVRRGRATGLTAEEIKKTIAEIRAKIPAQDWSEVSLEITTHQGLNPKSPYAGKRYGAFFAVPFQLVNPIVEAAGIQPGAANLRGFTICDGKLLRHALGGVQAFAETRSFPDAESDERLKQTLTTRARMKEAITGWLAQTTKPGDTVILYFSGHGAAIEDRDSPGGKLNYLVPADYLDVRALLALRLLDAAGKLEAGQQRLLGEMEGWLRDEKIVVDLASLKSESEETRVAASRALEAADALFTKRTCITDSEFAHWLQSLPNRRVVVILHACHSGGFAPDLGGAPTKGIPLKTLELPAARSAPFQFLQPKLVRLKDLGQTDTAFIAAAQADQTAKAPHFRLAGPAPRRGASLVAREVYEELNRNLKLPDSELPEILDPVSIFTFHLANVLLKANGPIDVETAAAQCDQEMKEYFASEVFLAQMKRENEDRAKKGIEPWDLKTFPHQPQWFDNGKPKILLKL